MTIDFTQNPLYSQAPITPCVGIPSNTDGFTGQVKQDVLTGNLYLREASSWTALLTPGCGSNGAFPKGMSANGIKSDGTIGAYPNAGVVAAASSVPGWKLDTTYPTLYSQMECIPLPAGYVGPDGWYDIYLEVAYTGTTAKGFSIQFGATTMAFTDSQTTAASSCFKFRISNTNSTSAQTSSGGEIEGVHTVANKALALDLSQYNSATIWANITGGTDTVQITRWSVVAYNPPVFATQRLQYGKKIFYGGNSHFDDGHTNAQIIAGMKTMGMKVLRITDEGGTSMNTIASIAQAFQADNTGLQVLLCIDLSISPDGTNLYISEQAAYTAAYAAARADALRLGPYGVTLYECGNEMDTKFGINTGDPQGGQPWNYDPTKVNIFRGIQRGAIDGIHSVNPAYTAMSNAYTVCSIGLSDLIWNGLNVDGTPAASGPCHWDVTSWHNYEDYGPLVAVARGSSPAQYVNIYEYVNRAYGVPIFITEWNGKSSDTDAQRAVWAKRFMYEAYANRYKYNIAGHIVYELWGGPWNVLNSDGTVQSTFGTTVQSFITSNPDSGT